MKGRKSYTFQRCHEKTARHTYLHTASFFSSHSKREIYEWEGFPCSSHLLGPNKKTRYLPVFCHLFILVINKIKFSDSGPRRWSVRYSFPQITASRSSQQWLGLFSFENKFQCKLRNLLFISPPRDVNPELWGWGGQGKWWEWCNWGREEQWIQTRINFAKTKCGNRTSWAGFFDWAFDAAKNFCCILSRVS